MNSKYYYDVYDISAYMGISIPMAYKIIRRLNDELKAQGYITVAGRISRKYFEEKIYGGVA